ncbi:MAG TPA: YegS/Rv2252/BmrU family lipid kinase [Candidatus Acidoferrales bacterium]
MNRGFLAIVNPAAGGGRCGRMARAALDQLRTAGVELEVSETTGPGQATALARAAYARGCRQFIAVGGDGTACEIVNGLFPEAATGERAALGFLPLGTGNSFLRDFTDRGAEHAAAAIIAGRRRACDVLRLSHAAGELYFINLLSMGFAADAAIAARRRFKRLGEFGYVLGVLLCLARQRRRAFPLRADGDAEMDRRRCLFLSFNNSKFTGGKMMIAPQASTNDGLIEYVRWGPVGRLQLARNFSALFDGSHIRHPQASRRAVRRIEFALDAPVDVMVDGEVLTLDCRCIDVLPGALDVLV